MAFHQFKGFGPIPGWRSETNRPEGGLTDPEGYQASEPLARAVNVALALDMPLLLTGEPGTGKTQLAYRLAAELGVATPLRFNTKSSSQVNDLFFSFDNVRYFAQSQINGSRNLALPEAKQFVRFEGLGEAIIRTLDRDEVADVLPPGFPAYLPGRSVVLVDEVDKAPRDFPNDLLNQLENLEFSVPELRKNPIIAESSRRPIVVITSNSEKQLPDPFLRRCTYHHIEFPKERIDAIVARRLRHLPLGSLAFEQAKEFFFKLRESETGLAKKPSLSELLDWLLALERSGLESSNPFASQEDIARGCLGTLAKTELDHALAAELLTKLRR